MDNSNFVLPMTLLIPVLDNLLEKDLVSLLHLNIEERRHKIFDACDHAIWSINGLYQINPKTDSLALVMENLIINWLSAQGIEPYAADLTFIDYTHSHLAISIKL